MTDKERIATLEKQVAELTKLVTTTKSANPWNVLSKEIETELSKVVDETHLMWSCKQAICTILGKSFRKNSVTMFDKENCEEAKEFINFTIDFIKKKREKYKNTESVSGYERKCQNEQH